MNQSMQKQMFVGALVLLLALLTACLGGSDPAANGQDILLTDTGVLMCNQACADRGQCGMLDDNVTQVVLLATVSPVLTGHNIYAPQNTAVTVIQSQDVPVVKNVTQEQLNARFYQVVIPEREPAWVAGWCVEESP